MYRASSPDAQPVFALGCRPCRDRPADSKLVQRDESAARLSSSNAPGGRLCGGTKRREGVCLAESLLLKGRFRTSGEVKRPTEKIHFTGRPKFGNGLPSPGTRRGSPARPPAPPPPAAAAAARAGRTQLALPPDPPLPVSILQGDYSAPLLQPTHPPTSILGGQHSYPPAALARVSTAPNGRPCRRPGAGTTSCRRPRSSSHARPGRPSCSVAPVTPVDAPQGRRDAGVHQVGCGTEGWAHVESFRRDGSGSCRPGQALGWEGRDTPERRGPHLVPVPASPTDTRAPPFRRSPPSQTSRFQTSFDYLILQHARCS